MNLQPINDRILVRLFEYPSAEQKIGSIIVPEVAREKENICGSQVYMDKPFHRGTVVAAGPGKLMEITCKRCGNESVTRREMSVKVGDVVLFGKFYDLAIDDLILLREDDIMGVEVDTTKGSFSDFLNSSKVRKAIRQGVAAVSDPDGALKKASGKFDKKLGRAHA